MQHVTPRQVRVRFYDEALRVEVSRCYGSQIACPECGAVKRSRSWSELRGWLREHLTEEHPDGRG